MRWLFVGLIALHGLTATPVKANGTAWHALTPAAVADALGVHTPFFQRLVGIAPIGLLKWVGLVALALTIVVVMEANEWVRGGRDTAAT